MRRIVVAMALALAFSGAAAADAKSPIRSRVALKLEDRTGYDYRPASGRSE